MNIEHLSNHLAFNKIFSTCKKDNGKIDWLKIVYYDNLPVEFIDQYFLKLKSFGIEKTQKLNTYVLNKYKYQLNWYSVIKYQNLSEEIIIQNEDIFERLNLWELLFKTQTLSLKFLVNHLNLIKEKDLKKSILSNLKIKKDDKITLCSLLSNL